MAETRINIPSKLPTGSWPYTFFDLFGCNLASIVTILEGYFAWPS